MEAQTERLRTIAEVAAFCRARSLPAELVGRWIWLFFEEKPSAEVRAKLKAAGFRWSRRRGGWAHNCGRPTGRGSGDPRIKYGSVKLAAAHEEALAQAVA